MIIDVSSCGHFGTVGLFVEQDWGPVVVLAGVVMAGGEGILLELCDRRKGEKGARELDVCSSWSRNLS